MRYLCITQIFTQSGVKSDKLFFDVDAKIIPVKHK